MDSSNLRSRILHKNNAPLLSLNQNLTKTLSTYTKITVDQFCLVNNQISVPLQALQNANDVILYISDEALGEQFVVHFVRDTTDTHANQLRYGINSQWQNSGYVVVANLRWIFATNSIVFDFLQKGNAYTSDYKLGIHTIWYK